MNNSVFRENNGECKKAQRYKLVTSDNRRNQLASEPNYHTKKYFSEIMIAIEIKQKLK